MTLTNYEIIFTWSCQYLKNCLSARTTVCYILTTSVVSPITVTWSKPVTAVLLYVIVQERNVLTCQDVGMWQNSGVCHLLCSGLESAINATKWLNVGEFFSCCSHVIVFFSATKY